MLKQFVITSVILQLSCLIMFSCKENEQNDFTLKIPKHDTGSIVLRDIPGSIVSSPVEVQKEWFEQVTGLTSLKNGYSGIQLRIYQDYNDYTGRVVMLRDSNDVWEAKLINYKTVYGKAGEMKAVSFQKINLNTPKSGWKKFADKLNDLKLKSIEKQEVMTETYDTEKVITTLEIANQNNYLFNKYTETNVGDNKQDVNKVQRLLYLIKNEYNI